MSADKFFLSFICALSTGLFTNSIKNRFVFNGNASTNENNSSTVQTNWLQMFENGSEADFLMNERSYIRPLTVATYKLNYAFDGLNPVWYHTVNIFLNTLVCCLFFILCCQILSVCSQHIEDNNKITFEQESKIKSKLKSKVKSKHRQINNIEKCFLIKNLSTEEKIIAYLATLLFTVHPIHTEAVCSISGRSELLCAIFSICAIIFAMKYSVTYVLYSSLFCVLSVASNEQGFASFVVCIIYYLFIANQITPYQVLTFRKLPSIYIVLRTTIHLCMLIVVFVLFRVSNSPNTEEFPIPHSNYYYLLPINAGLLLSPVHLVCDWSIDDIPMVTTISDPRNIATILFWCVLLLVALKSFSGKSGNDKIILFALSLLILTSMPTPGLLVSSEWILSEKSLYIPSMGYCLLVAVGFNKLLRIKTLKPFFVVMLLSVVLSHCVKTVKRNEDWKSYFTIYESALKIAPKNPKIWNKIGQHLEVAENYTEALRYYNQAVELNPEDVDGLINVGSVLNKLDKKEDAEVVFVKAKNILLKMENKKKTIPIRHLEVFTHLANLIKDDSTRLNEVDTLYQEVIGLWNDYIEAYINRGEILVQQNKMDEAIECYKNALQHTVDRRSDLYFNIGVVESHRGNVSGAMEAYTYAIYHDNNHVKALYNSAVMLEETGDKELLRRAKIRIDRILNIEPGNKLAFSLLGSIYLDMGDVESATKVWKDLLKIDPDSKSGMFNLAHMYSKEENQIPESLKYLDELLTKHPNHSKGLLLYGEIMLNHKRDVQSAKRAFLKILDFEPKNAQSQHNLCVVMFNEGKLEEAERCLLDVIIVSPDATHAKQNLEIVRKKIAIKVAREKERQEMNKLSFSDTKETVGDIQNHDEALPNSQEPEEEFVYIEPIKKKKKSPNEEKNAKLLKSAKDLLDNAKKSVERTKSSNKTLNEKLKLQSKAFEEVKKAIKQLESINKKMDNIESNKDDKKMNEEKKSNVDISKRKKEINDWLDELEKNLT